jgi:hypothetical protein
MGVSKTLMSLLVQLGVSTEGLDKGLDSAEKKAVSSASNIGKSLLSIGGTAVMGGIGLATAGLGVTAAALASTIGPASDLNETMNKVKVVFGDNADAMLKFGDSAASALGMSKNEALSAAGTYGNLFVAMGMGTDVSANMSKDLVKLAADLGSFNNMASTDVLEKLRAGLTGETEPLKSLGVNLSADIVKAKAMSMGLIGMTVDSGKLKTAQLALEKSNNAAAAATKKYGVNSVEARTAMNNVEKAQDAINEIMKGAPGELSAAAKAQATYALILEQTKTAQGDFGNTSMGLANLQKRLASSFEDVKAKIGTGILPALEKLGGVAMTFLSSPKMQEGIDFIVKKVGELSDMLIAALPGVIAFFEGLSLPSDPAAFFENIKKGIGDFMLGVAADFWKWVQPILAAAGIELNKIIVTIQDWLTANWPMVTEWLMAAAGEFWKWIDTVISTGPANLNNIMTVFNNWFAVNWPIISAKLAEWGNKFWDWVQTVAVPQVTTRMKALTDELVKWANSPDTARVLQNVGISLGTALLDGLKALVTNQQEMQKVGASILGALGWMVLNIIPILSTITLNLGKGMVRSIIEGIISDYTISEPVINFLSYILERINMGIVRGTWEIGWDIGMGIIRGLESVIPQLIKVAYDMAKNAIQTVKSILGIRSPSTVFAKIGQNMMLGWANGIEKFSSVPLNMTANIASGSLSAVSVPSTAGGGATIVNVSYSPMMSFSDEYQVAQKLGPAIRQVLRTA